MLSETIVDFGMRRAEYKKVKSETRKVEGELPSHKYGGQADKEQSCASATICVQRLIPLLYCIQKKFSVPLLSPNRGFHNADNMQ